MKIKKFIKVLLLIFFTNLWGWKGEYFKPVDYFYSKDGVKYYYDQLIKEYKSCIKKAVVRGEYETKKEFEYRKKMQLANCNDILTFKNAYREYKVHLKYNADNEYFIFYLSEKSDDFPVSRFYDYLYDNYSFIATVGENNSYWDYAEQNKNIYATYFDKFYFKKVIYSYRQHNSSHLISKKCIESSFDRWASSIGLYKCGRKEYTYRFSPSYVNHMKIIAYSPIKKARLLKSKEDSLYLRRYFDTKKSEKKYFDDKIKGFELIDKETDKVLFVIGKIYNYY